MKNLQARVDDLLEDYDLVDVLEAMRVTLEAQANDAAAKADEMSADDYALDVAAVNAALGQLPESTFV